LSGFGAIEKQQPSRSRESRAVSIQLDNFHYLTKPKKSVKEITPLERGFLKIFARITLYLQFAPTFGVFRVG